MLKCKTDAIIKGTVAGAVAAVIAGAVVGCGVRAVSGNSKKCGIKKSAKKALRTVERYIDNMI